MIDLPQIKKVVRLILQHNKKYNLHLKPNELNFLKKFRQENFAPTEKQLQYLQNIKTNIVVRRLKDHVNYLKHEVEQIEQILNLLDF